MGLSLDEYAAQHPADQIAAGVAEVNEIMQTWEERQQELEEAARLKENILTQLEQGNDPQLILYTALHCIGLYSADSIFTERAQGCLDSVYADLMQQSLMTDNAAIAAERLEAMQTEYNGKLRRSITRQLAGYRRIAAALNEALNAVDSMEQASDTEE